MARLDLDRDLGEAVAEVLLDLDAALLAARPGLRAYRDRTIALLGVLPDAAKSDAAESPLRLDEARRAALLARLRVPAASGETIPFAPANAGVRVIRFFRNTIAYSPGLTAALALLLVVGFTANFYIVELAKPVSHRAEEVEVFSTGAGGGASTTWASAWAA